MCKASLCLCARRFLERKLGKELCGKLRFPSVPVREIFCGSDGLRRSHFFIWRVPPCVAWERCYFARGGKVTKTPPGDAFDEHLALPVLIGGFPPVPLFTRVCPFGCSVISGGQNVDRFPFYSRPTGAYCHQNLQDFALYRTPPGAPLPVWFGGGRADVPATAQLPQLCQARRCPYSVDTSEFSLCRGLCPRGKKDWPVLILPAGRDCPINQEGVPRKRGSRGQRL